MAHIVKRQKWSVYWPVTAKIVGILTLLALHPAASSANCIDGGQADLVFVLDASGSVGITNFNLMKTFVIDFVSGLAIGENKVRVGVETFSTSAQAEFHLSQYYTQSEFATAVSNIAYPQGGTYTAQALAYLRQNMFTEANGDRPGIPNVGVIMVDGQSNSYSATAAEAQLIHAAGTTTLYAAGIGASVSQPELDVIATDPDVDHVFLGDFGTLSSNLLASLRPVVCMDMYEPPVSTVCSGTVEDRRNGTYFRRHAGKCHVAPNTAFDVTHKNNCIRGCLQKSDCQGVNLEQSSADLTSDSSVLSCAYVTEAFHPSGLTSSTSCVFWQKVMC